MGTLLTPMQRAERDIEELRQSIRRVFRDLSNLTLEAHDRAAISRGIQSLQDDLRWEQKKFERGALASLPSPKGEPWRHRYACRTPKLTAVATAALLRKRRFPGSVRIAPNWRRFVHAFCLCNLPIELQGPFRGLCLCPGKLRFPTGFRARVCFRGAAFYSLNVSPIDKIKSQRKSSAALPL